MSLTEPRARKMLLAGLGATSLMTVVTYVAPLLGLPRADEAGEIGSRLSGAAAPAGSAGWLLGMFVHYLNGTIVFPWLYITAGEPLLRGPGWFRGMQWGAVLWAASQMGLMPMVGKGFFCTEDRDQVEVLLETLVSHLLYGAAIGGALETTQG
jgi:hypothetical protein